MFPWLPRAYLLTVTCEEKILRRIARTIDTISTSFQLKAMVQVPMVVMPIAGRPQQSRAMMAAVQRKLRMNEARMMPIMAKTVLFIFISPFCPLDDYNITYFRDFVNSIFRRCTSKNKNCKKLRGKLPSIFRCSPEYARPSSWHKRQPSRPYGHTCRPCAEPQRYTYRENTARSKPCHP